MIIDDATQELALTTAVNPLPDILKDFLAEGNTTEVLKEMQERMLDIQKEKEQEENLEKETKDANKGKPNLFRRVSKRIRRMF